MAPNFGQESTPSAERLSRALGRLKALALIPMPANTNHIAIPQPGSIENPVWRYMSFTKFVSLLTSRSLFFCRADRLGDPFEGSVSKVKEVPQTLTVSTDEPIQVSSGLRRNIRNRMFLSCWHMNEHESAAMWRLYGKSNEAIAIQTTYRILRENLPETTYLGAVEYMDYSADSFDENNLFAPFFRKRRSFEHEREVRALYSPSFPPDHSILHEAKGHPIPVDLDRLLQSIFVSPLTPDWYYEMVRQVTAQFGLDKPVIRSELDDAPVF